MSADARNVWGPLTEGLNIPRDLDLGDRARALDQLGVTLGAHRTLMSRVNETLPQQEAGFLVSSRQWPVLALRMHCVAQEGVPFAAHHALTTPLDQALPTGPRVSTTAARSRSRSTVVPDTAPPKQPAPAEPAAPAHRQQTASAPRQGRGR